jgi:hypothetical protein
MLLNPTIAKQTMKKTMKRKAATPMTSPMSTKLASNVTRQSTNLLHGASLTLWSIYSPLPYIRIRGTCMSSFISYFLAWIQTLGVMFRVLFQCFCDYASTMDLTSPFKSLFWSRKYGMISFNLSRAILDGSQFDENEYRDRVGDVLRWFCGNAIEQACLKYFLYYT